MAVKYKPTDFGNKLAELRTRKRWTQRELANRSNLSQGLIESLEEGRRTNPKLTTCRKLSHALAISMDELLGDYDPCPVAAFSDQSSKEVNPDEGSKDGNHEQ